MEVKAQAFDLEERTYQFALGIRRCIKDIKWTREQWTDIDQLLRSSGSIAANYIEANTQFPDLTSSFAFEFPRRKPVNVASGSVY